MSEGKNFRCNNCGNSHDGWEGGNPYWSDQAGKKHYVYHPDPNASFATHIDLDYLCLGCGKVSYHDHQKTDVRCPKCKEVALVNRFELEGRICPKCKNGTFEVAGTMIS